MESHKSRKLKNTLVGMPEKQTKWRNLSTGPQTISDGILAFGLMGAGGSARLKNVQISNFSQNISTDTEVGCLGD